MLAENVITFCCNYITFCTWSICEQNVIIITFCCTCYYILLHYYNLPHYNILFKYNLLELNFITFCCNFITFWTRSICQQNVTIITFCCTCYYSYYIMCVTYSVSTVLSIAHAKQLQCWMNMFLASKCIHAMHYKYIVESCIMACAFRHKYMLLLWVHDNWPPDNLPPDNSPLRQLTALHIAVDNSTPIQMHWYF